MRRLYLILMLILLVACDADSAKRIIAQPSPTVNPPAEIVPTNPVSPPVPVSDADWEQLESGIEYRQFGSLPDLVHVVRIDPAQFRVRVLYDVNDAGRVSEWANAANTVAVVNGGYFDPQGRATALTIFDGVIYGTSYDGFGGMFSVDLNGTVQLRSLREQPYDSSEEFAQALQSSPMLVLHGAAVDQPNDDGDVARRSVIALDTSGRILLIASNWQTFTLTQLAQWLVDQPLDIDNALNLDGGSSTGLVVKTEQKSFTVDSFVRVPQVIFIQRN